MTEVRDTINNETMTHILTLIDEIITYYGILKIVLEELVPQRSKDEISAALEDKPTTSEQSKREHSRKQKR